MKEVQKINENQWGDSNGKRWEEYDTIVCPDGQIIDMQNLLDEQDRAKAALSRLLPALGGLVSRLKFIYSFRVATQATDGIHIICNPQFTYNLDLTGKCFVMAHEVMHCLLNHMRRGKEHKDHMRSNIAADYECNITLADMGVFKIETMKKIGAYVDPKYSTWGYESIYADCKSYSQDSMDNQKDQNQAGQNSGAGSGSGNKDQQFSEDFIKGWNKAIEDYLAGKIKI